MLNNGYGSAYSRRMKINSNVANSNSITYMQKSIKTNKMPEVKIVTESKIMINVK